MVTLLGSVHRIKTKISFVSPKVLLWESTSQYQSVETGFASLFILSFSRLFGHVGGMPLSLPFFMDCYGPI